MIDEFQKYEAERGHIPYNIHNDRRNSTPFITGDGFRQMASPYICDETNRCRFETKKVTPGSCIFVKVDFMPFFGEYGVDQITVPYILITHNGDLSAPDGQNDAGIGLPVYNTTTKLLSEYNAGRLIAHHGQNLWWVHPKTSSRPTFSHCIPIGLENRYNFFGGKLHLYVDALKKNLDLSRKEDEKNSISESPRKVCDDDRPLLLEAFHPKRQVPDRKKALEELGIQFGRHVQYPENPFFNHTQLQHHQWLEAITHHRFVMAPFGHGLDTHRMMEIFLMGGIPVVKKSTITSCYDDSDNQVNEEKPRGSLPLVVVDSWRNLNKTFLESEWVRIKSVDPQTWDWKRLLMSHWEERIGCKNNFFV